MGPVGNAFVFLIQTLFDLFIIVLIVRFFLQLVRADYYDPISQAVIKLTDFVLNPVRKFIPRINAFDASVVVVAFVAALVELLLLSIVSYGFPNIIGLLLLALVKLINLSLTVYVFMLIIQALLSWINPNLPIYMLLSQITSPLLNLIRRYVPLLANIDFSPLIAIIAVYLVKIVIVGPLFGLALRMTF